jgi:hypothetical protein
MGQSDRGVHDNNTDDPKVDKIGKTALKFTGGMAGKR